MSGGPGTAMGISVDLVTADQQAPLGFIHTVPASKGAGSGEQEWIYIQVEPAAPGPLNPGEMITFSPLTAGTVAPAGAATHPVALIGVAQHSIAPGEYGFILKSGVGLILADGAGLTALTPFVCDAAFPAATDSASTTNAAAGVTLDAAIGGGLTGQALIKL